MFIEFKEFIETYRKQLTLLSATLVLFGGLLGVLIYTQWQRYKGETSRVPTSSETSSSLPVQEIQEIIVDVSGAVAKPGVYKLSSGMRIGDALLAGGGVTYESASLWVAKNLNLAQVLTDSEKIYIPFEWDTYTLQTQTKENSNFDSPPKNIVQKDEESTKTADSKININAAGLSELDSLPGIGAKYAQDIIDARPFKNIDELMQKTSIPDSTIYKIKDLIEF